tara:strand:+ start:49389 stop:49736 length:348 start_codon:yes stop_codon:yes gene_type:complete
MKFTIKVIAILAFLYHLLSPMVYADNRDQIKNALSTMTKGEKLKIKRRYEKFKKMSPQRRARIKRKHKWFQSLPEKERARLKQEFRAIKKLPKDQRRKQRRKLMKQLKRRYQQTQ